MTRELDALREARLTILAHYDPQLGDPRIRPSVVRAQVREIDRLLGQPPTEFPLAPSTEPTGEGRHLARLAQRVDDLIGQLQASAFDDPDMQTAEWERRFAKERQGIAQDFAWIEVGDSRQSEGLPTLDAERLAEALGASDVPWPCRDTMDGRRWCRVHDASWPSFQMPQIGCEVWAARLHERTEPQEPGS